MMMITIIMTIIMTIIIIIIIIMFVKIAVIMIEIKKLHVGNKQLVKNF